MLANLPDEFVSLVAEGVWNVRDLLNQGDGNFVALALVGDMASHTSYPLDEGERLIGEPVHDFIRRTARTVDADFAFLILYLGVDSTHAVDTIGFLLETYSGLWLSRVPVEIANGRKTVGEVRMCPMPIANASLDLLPPPRGSRLH